MCALINAAAAAAATVQAEKLSSLGGLGKEKSAKTLAESEKLLADTVKHCEEMVAGASAALEGMRSR
jgi:hypothetical protein